MGETHGQIEGHVVCIVEAWKEGQIGYVCDVHNNTEERPE